MYIKYFRRNNKNMIIFLHILLFIFFVILMKEIYNYIIKIYNYIGELNWFLTKFRIYILISYILILIYLFYIGLNKLGDQKNINQIFINLKLLNKNNNIIDILLIIISLILIILLFLLIIGLYIKLVKISIQSLYYYLYQNKIFKDIIYKITLKFDRIDTFLALKFQYLIIKFKNYKQINNFMLKFFKFFEVTSYRFLALILKLIIFLPIILSLYIILYDYYIYKEIILYNYYYIVIYYPIYNLIINILNFLFVDYNKYILDLIIVSLTYRKEKYIDLIKEDKLECWMLIKNVKKKDEFYEKYGPFYLLNFI